MKTVQANVPGWQLECWELATDGVQFTVEGFLPENLPFFEELRMAYRLKTEPTGAKMIFSPPRSE
jgi:hypothetical protein